MVRLETSTGSLPGAARVTLTPVGSGDTIELELLDNGSPPDVSAGDGIYAGTSFVDADSFAVTLDVGGKTYDGGEATWAADAGPARDLVIRLVGDEIAVVASQPLSGGAPQDGAAGAGAPTAAAGAPVAAAPTSPVPAGVSRNDALLWLAIGVGLVVLAGAGLVASRWMGRSRDAGPEPLDEPGLFGAGTPSLTAAPAWWVLGEEDTDALRAALLNSVARQHRVLVVAPSGTAAPTVLGGPAYAVGWDADAAADAAFALLDRDGPRVVAVLCPPDAAPATVQPVLDALPEGVGALIVTTTVPQGTEATVVRLRRDGAGAVLDTASERVALRAIGTALEALGRA